MTEIRAFNVDEFRIEDRDGQPVVSGYAAVFNQRSVDLGGFVEEIAPGAFTNLEDDIRALWNHNADKPLGRTSAGTLSVIQDDVGLRFEFILPDTSYGRDLRVSMERGDVNQMSFGFRTNRDRWETLDESRELRTLLELRLREVSPVTFPAYPQTTAQLRNMRPGANIDDIVSEIRSHSPAQVRNEQPDDAPTDEAIRSAIDIRDRELDLYTIS